LRDTASSQAAASEEKAATNRSGPETPQPKTQNTADSKDRTTRQGRATAPKERNPAQSEAARKSRGVTKQTLANPNTTSVPKRRDKETHLRGFYWKGTSSKDTSAPCSMTHEEWYVCFLVES
jgi:hypothetical protein